MFSDTSPQPFIFLFSAFIMDEFKRKYSNEDTLTVAIPHFWEHFDREGYSIWYSQYKYPEELTLTFKSCNLITGETRQWPLYKTLYSFVYEVALLWCIFFSFLKKRCLVVGKQTQRSLFFFLGLACLCWFMCWHEFPPSV